VLLGCGAVLGLLIVVAIGLVAFGVHWFTTPGRQIPTAVVVGPESAGEVRLARLGADPGMRALIQSYLEEVEAAAERHGDGEPAFLRSLRDLHRAQTGMTLAQWLPSESTLSFELRPEDDGMGVAAAFNFPAYVRPIRAFLEHTAKSDPHVKFEARGSHTLIRFRSGFGLCFAGGTLLVADRVERLRPILDRVEQRPPPTASRSSELRDLEGRFDAYGVMGRPESARLFIEGLLPAPSEPLATQAALEGLQRTRFGLDVVSADRAEAWLELVYGDATAAQAAEPAVAEALAEIATLAQGHALRLETRVERAGDRLAVPLHFDGLVAALRSSLATRAEQAPEPARDVEDAEGLDESRP
jgi:hypothetical protein